MRRSKFRRPSKVLIFNGARVLVAIVRYYRTKNEKTSLKQRFKEVFRYFVLFYLDSLSGKRDSSPRYARTVARELCLHPLPLEGVSGVASDESSCQTKKAARLDSFFVLSGKREFNLCSPIILSAKILRFFRFTFEFPSNSFGRFSGTDITVLCPP